MSEDCHSSENVETVIGTCELKEIIAEQIEKIAALWDLLDRVIENGVDDFVADEYRRLRL